MRLLGTFCRHGTVSLLLALAVVAAPQTAPAQAFLKQLVAPAAPEEPAADQPDASAATPADAAKATTLTPEQTRLIADMLRDPVAREALIGELDRLAAERSAAASAAAPAAGADTAAATAAQPTTASTARLPPGPRPARPARGQGNDRGQDRKLDRSADRPADAGDRAGPGDPGGRALGEVARGATGLLGARRGRHRLPAGRAGRAGAGHRHDRRPVRRPAPLRQAALPLDGEQDEGDGRGGQGQRLCRLDRRRCGRRAARLGGGLCAGGHRVQRFRPDRDPAEPVSERLPGGRDGQGRHPRHAVAGGAPSSGPSTSAMPGRAADLPRAEHRHQHHRLRRVPGRADRRPAGRLLLVAQRVGVAAAGRAAGPGLRGPAQPPRGGHLADRR